MTALDHAHQDGIKELANTPLSATQTISAQSDANQIMQ